MYYQQRKLPLVVKKSNELIRAELSVENNALANKIFCTLIRNLTEESFPTVLIPTAQILTQETRGGMQLKSIKKAARVLMRATVDSIQYDNNGNEIAFKYVNIFSSCSYEKGLVTAKFNPEMKPHLLELKKRFTILNYFELIELPSFYSQRIYEILKSWEKPEGFVELGLEAFHDMISFPKEMREDFSFVRRKALEKAEKDINTRTELKYKWEPIKEGRKVVGIRFIIGESGPISQKKRQAKKEEKERSEAWKASAQRQPHIKAALACRREKGIKTGEVCTVMKVRTKKCQICRQIADVRPTEERLF